MEIETIQPTFGDVRSDAVIVIVYRDEKLQFAVEVKKWTNRATLGMAIQQLNKYPYPRLLLTRYLTPQMGDFLKENNVQYIDMAGNAYSNEPPLFIHIEGRKLPHEHRPKPRTRAFQPAGLKVAFALLCDPRLINKPYRQMAEIAGVALGTVGWVIRDLKDAGHVINLGKRGRRLVEKGKLLERWVTAYPEQLKPKILEGKFKAEIEDWWKLTDLAQQDFFWGGEIAAARLTKYLKPQTATVYVDHPIIKFVKKCRLMKHPQGDTEILRVFWNFRFNWGHDDLVHPIIIYADLLATGDPRNAETAQIIYDQEIAGLIHED